MVERIAGWSARHRKTAVLGWLALVAVVFAGGQMLSAKDVPSYDVGQSGQAERTLHRLGGTTPPAESVLIQARAGARPGGGGTFAADPRLRQAAAQLVAALRALPNTAQDVRSPLSPGGASLISADGRSALVTFKVAGNAANEDKTVGPALHAVAGVQARYPGLLIEEAGDASGDRAINALVDSDFRTAQVTSVPVTLILLLLVFGALIAAGIPVLLAITAVMTAISLLAIPGHWLPVGQNTSEVVLLIGMAVGVDYSLFYLRREREERANGASVGEALRIAAGTSGRAIVISGLTVMVALGGLFLTGAALFTGMAIGAITVVGVTVIGSLTVLPALLAWLGRWVDRGRIPFLGRRRTAARPSRLWAALVRRVVRHPLAWGGVASVALLALAAPALGMRLAYPAIDVPNTVPIVATMDKIAARASADGPIRKPVTATAVAGGRALIIDVPLAGNGQDSASDRALLTLRNQALPATLGKVTGISYAVMGSTAGSYDDTRLLAARTPMVLVAVAALAFLLLLVAFRSITLPLVSIGLNLLSVGAAYGLITLIFQDGRLQGPLQFNGFGAITSWVPLFMFVFLFGLSMDYHVFILSRIREQHIRGATTREAITSGIASSAGVVTSAAVIMMAVFSIFASLHVLELKMLGVGLPAAIGIDATIVRGILVPAAMAVLGDRCWYLPRWLCWLPGRQDRAPDPESRTTG